MKNQRNSKLNEIWCQRLRHEMDIQGFSQKDVADGTGIKIQSINYYYNGKRAPSFTQLVKLAVFLKVSTDYLLGAKDFKSAEKDEQQVFLSTGLNLASIRSLKLMIENDKADISLRYDGTSYYEDRHYITKYSILNYMLSNIHFYELLRALEYSRIFGGLLEVYGELKGFGTADDISVSELHRVRAYQAFQSLVEDYLKATFEQDDKA